MSTAVKRKRQTKGQKEYLAKLRDPRWQKRRNDVLIRDEYTCQMCGANESHGRNLQVHHAFYSKRFEFPWEYPIETLYTMCEKCHPAAETIKQQIYGSLAYVSPRYQHHVFYAIREFIEQLEAGESYEPVQIDWAIKQ